MTPSTRAALLPAASAGVLAIGLLLRLAGAGSAAHLVWLSGLLFTAIPIVSATARGLARGRFAADIVASLAIITAIALDHPIPGLIVVLMQSGGEALERRAEGRASQAVRELEARAPRQAHRIVGSRIEEIPAPEIETGDLLLVRPGEIIPCDGLVVEGQSDVDASGLTGEPMPIAARPGVRLLSGSFNGASPLTLRALAPSAESQYARIVELVRHAQSSKSRFQRLADRYAVWFTPLTLLTCAVAWLASGDPVRVLAVLVIATPCPMILATPVAVIGGVNLAARRMIIFRHGAALEQLGSVNAAVFDKTGTLTVGRPQVRRVVPVAPFTEPEVLRLAAAVEQGSSHIMARTLVEAAARRGILPPPALQSVEHAGQGVTGQVDGREVTVGGRSFVREQQPGAWGDLNPLVSDDDGLRALVAVDGKGAGIVYYEDALRPGLETLVSRLRGLGVRRILLLSGDHAATVESVARAAGVDQAAGDQLPGAKAERVRQLQAEGYQVAMVGDGTNDAPALSAADVGLALAAGGSGISAEAADVILLGDDPGDLVQGILISRRTLRIARQSLWAGLGLSLAGMVLAALGRLPPTAGALVQEAIDVAVILNALRASRIMKRA